MSILNRYYTYPATNFPYGYGYNPTTANFPYGYMPVYSDQYILYDRPDFVTVNNTPKKEDVKWEELGEYLGRCAEHIFALKEIKQDSESRPLGIALGDKEQTYMGNFGIACVKTFIHDETFAEKYSKKSEDKKIETSIVPSTFNSFFEETPDQSLINFLEETYTEIALKINASKITFPCWPTLASVIYRHLDCTQSLTVTIEMPEFICTSELIQDAFKEVDITIETPACEFIGKFFVDVVKKILERSENKDELVKEATNSIIKGKITERIGTISELWLRLKADRVKCKRYIPDSFISDHFSSDFNLSYFQLNFLIAVVEMLLREFLRHFEDHTTVNVEAVRDFIKAKPCLRDLYAFVIV